MDHETNSRWTLLICGALVVITLAAYYPATGHGFLDYDDQEYVTNNPKVTQGLSWAGVIWAFASFHSANWHPVTWLSHMTDVELFGLKPAGHHWVNLLLHAANSVLLFLLLQFLTKSRWRCAIVAALFALHPLHVESVAWVSERKDVLSTFFGLLCSLAYCRYVKDRELTSSAGTQTTEAARPYRPWRYYWLAVALLALGLMSKPMLVTLPLLLLALDYWPLQRQWNWRRLVLEKLPFAMLAAASSLVTLQAQGHTGAVQPLAFLSVTARASNALISYVRYLGKTFWPFDLAAPYAHPWRWELAQVLGAGVLLLGLTVGVIWMRRRFPFLAFGWFWFVVSLIPVIGIVQVGDQAMADRYMYLPMVGLLVGLIWGGCELCGWRRLTLGPGLIAALLLLGCGLRARNQVWHWRSTESLFRHAVTVTDRNWLAGLYLANELSKQGRVAEAIAAYRKVVEIRPKSVDAWLNLGFLLTRTQSWGEALDCFEAALRVRPTDVEARHNLAGVLIQLGRYDEALQHFKVVLAARPQDAEVLRNLGDRLSAAGQFAKAVTFYQTALYAGGSQPETHHRLARALARLGRDEEAVAHLNEALLSRRDYPEALQDLHAITNRPHRQK